MSQSIICAYCVKPLLDVDHAKKHVVEQCEKAPWRAQLAKLEAEIAGWREFARFYLANELTAETRPAQALEWAKKDLEGYERTALRFAKERGAEVNALREKIARLQQQATEAGATARAEEKEACAKVAEADEGCQRERLGSCGHRIAAAIRARAAPSSTVAAPPLGECVGHLGPPSVTTPHPKGETCYSWKPVAAAPPAVEEAARCTGLTAVWCPIHGDCKCPTQDNGELTLDDRNCPLHSQESTHNENADDAPAAEPVREQEGACLAGVIGCLGPGSECAAARCPACCGAATIAKLRAEVANQTAHATNESARAEEALQRLVEKDREMVNLRQERDEALELASLRAKAVREKSADLAAERERAKGLELERDRLTQQIAEAFRGHQSLGYRCYCRAFVLWQGTEASGHLHLDPATGKTHGPWWCGAAPASDAPLALASTPADQGGTR